MIGAIIGDIVGSRFEFNNHLSKDFELFHKLCEFTDDTICTVAVADWLMNRDKEDLTATMRYWCRKYPSPMGGYGVSFGRWVNGYIGGPYNSFGNGSAMRVSPVAWLSTGHHLTYREVIYNAEASARITHDHPEGIKGAVCIADLIYRIANGASKGDVIERSSVAYGYKVGLTGAGIRAGNSFNETCQVTVPQAITCFLESTTFEDAIRLAVSIGGDSDTIAAITGSLAEAYYGVPDLLVERAMSYLPPDMKEVINKFNSIYK